MLDRSSKCMILETNVGCVVVDLVMRSGGLW